MKELGNVPERTEARLRQSRISHQHPSIGLWRQLRIGQTLMHNDGAIDDSFPSASSSGNWKLIGITILIGVGAIVCDAEVSDCYIRCCPILHSPAGYLPARHNIKMCIRQGNNDFLHVQKRYLSITTYCCKTLVTKFTAKYLPCKLECSSNEPSDTQV